MPRTYEELFPDDERDPDLAYDDEDRGEDDGPRHREAFIDAEDRRHAKIIAHRRQSEAVAMGLEDAHGRGSENGLASHTLGAYGEVGTAKVLGRPWDATVNTFKRGGDVGDYQVRTRSNHDWDLLVRADDRDDDVFILATAVDERMSDSRIRVHGWLYGREAKRDEWVRTYGGRPPAWFAPQSALRDLSSLPRSEPDDEPEALYTGPRSAQEAEALDDFWAHQAEDTRIARAERSLEKRRRQEAERAALYAAEQRRRKAATESGERADEQPDPYKGTAFVYGTIHGTAYTPYPPYRDDPQAPLNLDFIDFQRHHHLTRVVPNRQYYCAECDVFFAGVVCPHAGCRSARVRYPKPEEDGTGLRRYCCLTCSRDFEAERVCGSCLAKRPEVQAKMREEERAKRKRLESRKGKTRVQATRAGSRIQPLRDESLLYPD